MNRFNKYLSLGFIFVCLASCAPTSLQDLRYEVESEMKKLAFELRAIETTEELQRRSFYIKKRFNKMAHLLIETRNFVEISSEPSLVAEELFVELARLYEIPGMRELLENLQDEAVHLLDQRKRRSIFGF